MREEQLCSLNKRKIKMEHYLEIMEKRKKRLEQDVAGEEANFIVLSHYLRPRMTLTEANVSKHSSGSSSEKI